MYVSDQKIEEAIKLFREHGPLLRTSEALESGIHSRTLYYMLVEGHITKLERGLYKLADEGTLSNPSLTIVVKKVPKARICLISALDIHELTTAIPHHVYIALPRTSRDPKLNYPPLQIYRFSGPSLTEGIETHEVDGVEVQVYNPAKTIADCFKFRNQIGLDIAIEALKDGIRQKKASFMEIEKFARICRVQNVIRPYAETLAHS
ncbi:type IV toxin-antitoxin system AbiEi family antitoxin domain-containing protein [Fodinibius sediminis]|uniref:Transcriptional regulator, AbiEi antitoxin, Type IV TA system n=1 Tax=Fodinibius sediminis TaxID=1214077 RepID=A0A521ASR5_9BACT|nr:type IV toxin-antitoxin system AbiEi family antitoxin domain-containing protein [Fodinibius sediminis]SMO37872.1 Transcriptional regulator, AbiEi antitoxin, Type IV TA system [Fodinibius sediminis]